MAQYASTFLSMNNLIYKYFALSFYNPTGFVTSIHTVVGTYVDTINLDVY
jgi:hypothetical protein